MDHSVLFSHLLKLRYVWLLTDAIAACVRIHSGCVTCILRETKGINDSNPRIRLVTGQMIASQAAGRKSSVKRARHTPSVVQKSTR